MKTIITCLVTLLTSLLITSSTFGSIQIFCPKDLDLGVNPERIPQPDISNIKFKNRCDREGVEVKHIADDYTTKGCYVEIKRSYQITNRCGESDECTQRIVFIKDDDPPIVPCTDTIRMACGNGLKDIPKPDPDDIWPRDACGDQNGEHQSDTISNVGCKYTLKRTYVKNNTTCIQYWCWYELDDLLKPGTCYTEIDLGCNPDFTARQPDPINDFIWKRDQDPCEIDITYYDTEIINKFCHYSMERVWLLTDACGNTSECIQKLKWIETEPKGGEVICPEDVDLGCNPDLSKGLPKPTRKDYKRIEDNFRCKVTIDYEDSFSINAVGCTYFNVRLWKVTDQCGHVYECNQSFYWTQDNEPPVIIQYPEDLFLGCLTEHPEIDDSKDILAVDNCGEFSAEYLFSYYDVNPDNCWHVLKVDYKVADECGNATYYTQEVSYKLLNNLPPEPSIPVPADITVCGPVTSAPDYDAIYDACGVGYPVLVSSSIQNGPCNDGDGCIITRQWRIRGCGTLFILENQTITVECDFTYESNQVNTPANRKSKGLISVAPNPGHNMTQVTWRDVVGHEGQVVVYDQTGRKVYEATIPDIQHRNAMDLDASNWNTGIYFIHLTTEQDSRSVKFVKQ